MKIRIAEPIACGAAFAVPVLLRCLQQLPKDPLGSHSLGALGTSAQIVLSAGAAVGEPPDGAQLELHARTNAAAFPVFRGTVRIEAVDVFSARIILAGQYSVPLGFIGAAADRTLLAGAAKRSLRALLSDIRAHVAASALQNA